MFEEGLLLQLKLEGSGTRSISYWRQIRGRNPFETRVCLNYGLSYIQILVAKAKACPNGSELFSTGLVALLAGLQFRGSLGLFSHVLCPQAADWLGSLADSPPVWLCSWSKCCCRNFGIVWARQRKAPQIMKWFCQAGYWRTDQGPQLWDNCSL